MRFSAAYETHSCLDARLGGVRFPPCEVFYLDEVRDLELVEYSFPLPASDKTRSVLTITTTTSL